MTNRAATRVAQPVPAYGINPSQHPVARLVRQWRWDNLLLASLNLLMVAAFVIACRP